MKNLSQELKDLIGKMLQPEKKRITMEEIFSHPWMMTNLGKTNLRLSFGKMMNFAKYSKVH
jgi:hypothetical protein